MPRFRRSAHTRTDPRTGQQIQVRAHDVNRSSYTGSETAFNETIRRVTGQAEGGVDDVRGSMSNVEPRRWWRAQRSVRETNSYLPGSAESDWEYAGPNANRRTHRMTYTDTDGSRIKMPSTTALRRMHGRYPGSDQMVIPVEVATGDGREMVGSVLLTKRGDGRWIATGHSGAFTGSGERVERALEGIQAQAEGRHPRTAIRDMRAANAVLRENGGIPPRLLSREDIPRVTVESSSVESIGYDRTSRLMNVKFRGAHGGEGRLYTYQNVSPATAEAFVTSDSPGSFFNDNFRGQNHYLTGFGDRPGVQHCSTCGEFIGANGHNCHGGASESPTLDAAWEHGPDTLANNSTFRAAERVRAGITPPRQAQNVPPPGTVYPISGDSTVPVREPVVENVGESYGENPGLFNAQYREGVDRIQRGESPTDFVSAGVDGMPTNPQEGPGFGVEIEFDLDGVANRAAALQAIANDLHAEGIIPDAAQTRYHGRRSPGKWAFEQDCTVSGEIVSPVLYNRPEDWDNLAKVCEIVKRHGGVASTACGGHVHVGTGNMRDNPAAYTRLMNEFEGNQDALFRMGTNPARGSHRGRQWCAPNRSSYNEYVSVSQAAMDTQHSNALNLSNVHGRADDNAEFRHWDGTLDPGVIQSQVALSYGMVHAAHATPTESVSELPVRRPPGTQRVINRELRSHQAAEGGPSDRLIGDRWNESTEATRRFIDRVCVSDDMKQRAARLFAGGQWLR